MLLGDGTGGGNEEDGDEENDLHRGESQSIPVKTLFA